MFGRLTNGRGGVSRNGRWPKAFLSAIDLATTGLV